MSVLPLNKWREFALILLITALPVIPTVLLGYHQAHDLETHVQSWVDVSAQMRQGILFPRWAARANYGFGEPRFIFYPPASWMLGGMLGLFLPWRIVPAVFVWLTLILAAVSMRMLARDWLPPRAALLAGLLYALNPYLLVSAFTRCAFGELLASAVFPLLVWGALRLERDRRKGFGIVAVVFAAIWLSNLPAGVIAGYSLLCILPALAMARRSWRPLLLGAGAALSGIGLAAFSLVPAAVERSWVNIGAIFTPAERPDENFLFAHNSLRVRTLFNHRVSLLAVLVIVAGIAAIILARRFREKAPTLWWPVTALCVASSFLMVRWSSPLWQTLPELRFVQFPWRWLFPLCTATALLIALVVSTSKRRRVLWPAIWLVAGVLCAGIVYTKDWYPHVVDRIAVAAESGRGYRGLPEYTPIANETLSIPEDAPYVAPVDWHFERANLAGATVYVENWSAERREIRTDSAHPMTVDLKLLAYPGWTIKVDGKAVPLQADPQTGQVQVSLPAGVSRIELQFKRTRDRSIGILISLSTAALLLLAELLLRRRKPVRQPRTLQLAEAA
jgi:uncharacterized membrane protein YfhO